jgi:hypothetical protein
MTDYIKQFLEKKPKKEINDTHPWKKALSPNKMSKDKEDKKYLDSKK